LLEFLTLRVVNLKNPKRGLQVLATQGKRVEAGPKNYVLLFMPADRSGDLLFGVSLAAERMENIRPELSDRALKKQFVNEFGLAEIAFGGTQEMNRHIVFEYYRRIIETMYGSGGRDTGGSPTFVYAQQAHKAEFRFD
jgi:hypothetical protein